MAKQQPSTDMVRFQLSQFPDLMPLADRVGADGEGRGGLVREIRRLVRLGMAVEAAGIGAREIQGLADGALQLALANSAPSLPPGPRIAPMSPETPPAAHSLRTAHPVAGTRHAELSRQEAHREVATSMPSPAPLHPHSAPEPMPIRREVNEAEVLDPVLDAFIQ